MNKTFAIAVLFISIFSIDAIAQMKIGYTNPSKVLSQLPEVEEIEKTINDLITKKDNELRQKAANLQKTFTDYEASMGELTQQERNVREQELMELNQQFEAERTKMLEDVQLKRNELLQPILQKMDAAMTQVASEMELDLILNEGTSSGDMIIFFAKSENLDVTSRIVEIIKQS